MSNDLSLFHLETHPTARSRAVTSSSLLKGTVVLSTTPIATVLLDSEKGRRCDYCLRASAGLQRCTACKDYWYCGSNCQLIAWKAHHRRLCKRLVVFTSSTAYVGLSPQEKHHALLLAHLLAEHAKSLSSAFLELSTISSQDDLSDPITAMMSLLPQHNYRHVVPPINLEDPTLPESLSTFLSSRFANNNFTIHCARTVVFAHGVFSLASRSFNHSCVPCAVPVYRHIKGTTRITMEIRLLRDMDQGEEITIPYTDPALPHSTRQLDLELTYGFTCKCFLCRQVHLQPVPVASPAELALWETGLRENVLPSFLHRDSLAFELRESFLRTWHPSYLLPLTEAFSNASHDGPYELAIQKGAALLAVYSAIYPPNFPIIGLHALELAKTCWNAYMTGVAPPGTLQDIDAYLIVAERTFHVVFDDVTGNTAEEEPIAEVKVLREMLISEVGQKY